MYLPYQVLPYDWASLGVGALYSVLPERLNAGIHHRNSAILN
jgi:hypothetical protein